MFKIKAKVIDDLARYSHLSYIANTRGGFINISHEYLETEAYLEVDNLTHIFVLKTRFF